MKIALRRAALAVVGGLATTLAVTAAGTPAAARQAAPAEKPDIRVTAKADRDTYAVGDTIKLTIEVSNQGTVAATGVHPAGLWSSGVDWPTDSFEALKFDLAAGAARTVNREGKINSGASVNGRAQVVVRFFADNGEANVGDNFTLLNPSVPGQTGTLRGEATEAVNQPGAAGRGVQGVTFTVTGSYTDKVVATGKTGPDGVLVIPNIPADRYDVTYAAPAGWELTTTTTATVVTIGGAEVTKVPVTLRRTGANPPANPTASVSPSGSASATVTPAGSAVPSPAGGAGATGGKGGALPVTGAQSGLVAGAGVALLALGALAYFVSRRRRTRFVAAD